MKQRKNISSEEKLRLLCSENSQLLKRLSENQEEIAEIVRSMEGDAQLKSQPPTAPGNPPPKGGEG